MEFFEKAEKEGIDRYDSVEEIDAFREGALWTVPMIHKTDIDNAWNFIIQYFQASSIDTDGRIWYGNQAITKDDFIKFMNKNSE